MCDLTLSCQCGTVKGIAKTVTPSSSNRVVCYCSDCQAFARELGAEDRVLNEFGGTELFQLAPARVQLTQGHDHIACLHISEKGTFRWYAACCNTPIGNTVSPKFPMIGLIHAFVETDLETKAEDLGPVRAHCQTQYAWDNWPSDQKRNAFPLGISLRLMGLVLSWKLRGRGSPNPLFTQAGAPIAQPRKVERKA
ncbi:DUF6151 family protein [Pacificibacter sp.]|uniref:DUF6151 family protein n=1 Tax=Pacificibacter sp. TaxID=1917866 RepID=UPI00321A8DA7